MDAEFALVLGKFLGAGIATLALAGVGLALGKLFGAFMSGAFRNPEAVDKVFPVMLLAAALTEAIGLFALVVALLMLFVF